MPTIDLYIHIRIDAADPHPPPLTSQNVKKSGESQMECEKQKIFLGLLAK